MENWEKTLDDCFEQQRQFEEAQKQRAETNAAAIAATRKRADEFMLQVVEPAFRKLADKLKQNAKKVSIEGGDVSRVLEVQSGSKPEFMYALDINSGAGMATVGAKYKAFNKSGHPLEQGGGTIMKDNRETDISHITETDIIHNFVEYYTRPMRLAKML